MAPRETKHGQWSAVARAIRVLAFGTPPPEMSSDAEVLAFVRSHAGAVGYVSNAAPLVNGLKAPTLTT